MLFLVFRLGDEGYALAGEDVVEVLPLIEISRIRGAPSAVIGLINYRGSFVPVVDLCELELSRPSARRMGTRIVIVDLLVNKRVDRLGLIVERATETLRCAPEAFAPFASGPQGLVQRIQLEGLLPRHLQDFLFERSGALA